MYVTYNIISHLGLAQVVERRNDCYHPHPGSIPTGDMLSSLSILSKMASTPVINQLCSLKFLWFILGNILKVMRENAPGFSLRSVTWKKEYNLLLFVRIYIFLKSTCKCYPHM